mgnify:CR=1 FL=1
MAIHSYHPDIHAYGLADNCERCEQHAEHPLDTLDDSMLTDLILRVRRDNYPRSNNEAAAMNSIRQFQRNYQNYARVLGKLG